MDAKLFTKKAWGQVVTAAEGFPAFVPDPPPQSLRLSDEAIGLLDDASHRMGILQGIGQRLPNPHLLISPCLRREAVLSSRIEGTQTSMSDLYASEIDQQQLIRSPDVREVRNYVGAQEWGLSALDELPLSLRLLRELHRRLMTGVRGREHHPGEFRTYQNWIGAPRGEDATYVGPPVDAMRERLGAFEGFLHDRSLRPLVQAAVIHYEFEAIHPFGDGNGRVGRLLVPIFLAERELLPQPLLYLSAYFERNRSDYYEGLMRVSTHGDWDQWVRFFLSAVCVQAQEAAALADQLLGLWERYRLELQAKHVTGNVLALIDALFFNPLVDVKRAESALSVTAPTARSVIKVLEEHRVLAEITGRKWGKVWRADEIDRVLRGEQ